MSVRLRLLGSVLGIAAVVLCFLPALAFGGRGVGWGDGVGGTALAAPPPGVTKHADALSFFPRNVTVHVGDTVTWQFFGFHTVTFPGTKRPYPFATPMGKQPRMRTRPGSRSGGRARLRCSC